jgi:hypothetical protein
MDGAEPDVIGINSQVSAHNLSTRFVKGIGVAGSGPSPGRFPDNRP